MRISEVSTILAEYLGLPIDLIFEQNTEKLTDMCIDELSRIVTLPGGFEFSSSFRPPNKGELFLDLKALVSENRLLVYKALESELKNKAIIMRSSKNSDSLEKVSFCLDFCVDNANIAYMGTSAVTLLTPYVDSRGYVAVLDHRHRLMLVHVDELSNTLDVQESPQYVTDSLLGITEEDRKFVDNLLRDVREDMSE
tara:strand:- start:4964 stop:5551 length:588 start_codon:yes stop_codon:yes gene_type:complete